MNQLYPLLFNLSALIALAFMHLFWLFGGKTVLNYAYPHFTKNKKKIHGPSKIKLFFITLLIILMSFFCIAQTDLLNLKIDREIINWGNRGSAIILLMRAIGNFKFVGFTKSFTSSDFAKLDTYIYSPICLIMAFCAIISTLYF